MNPNVKAGILYPVKGSIAPQNIAAAGNATTGATYIDVSTGIGKVRVVVNLGAPGGGTLSLDLLQATSSAGAGSKALVTGAITGMAATGIFEYEFQPEDIMDFNNLFKFLQARLNNVGGTGALASLTVQIGPQRFDT